MFMIQEFILDLLPPLGTTLDFLNLLGRLMILGLRPTSTNHVGQRGSLQLVG
jgi:hypothetical protein